MLAIERCLLLYVTAFSIAFPSLFMPTYSYFPSCWPSLHLPTSLAVFQMPCLCTTNTSLAFRCAIYRFASWGRRWYVTTTWSVSCSICIPNALPTCFWRMACLLFLISSAPCNSWRQSWSILALFFWVCWIVFNKSKNVEYGIFNIYAWRSMISHSLKLVGSLMYWPCALGAPTDNSWQRTPRKPSLTLVSILVDLYISDQIQCSVTNILQIIFTRRVLATASWERCLLITWF